MEKAPKFSSIIILNNNLDILKSIINDADNNDHKKIIERLDDLRDFNYICLNNRIITPIPLKCQTCIKHAIAMWHKTTINQL